MGSHLVEDWTSSSRVFPLCAMKMSMWLNEKQQNTSARKLPLNGELTMPSRSEAIQSVNNRQQVSCRSWVKLVRCHHSGFDTEMQARGR